jgi:hypothetical protein
MRVRTIFKVSMLVPALCLAALPAFAQQDSSQQSTGDPVADAARRARAQKKDEAKPKKVFTDDDVKPAQPSATAPAAAAAASGVDSKGKGGDLTKEGATGGEAGGKNGEAAWRKRFQAQRDNIASAEKELDILQREQEKAQVEYYPDPQKALAEQNTRKDISDLNKKIDDKKAEIAKLRQGLDDLTDALRKAGGEPGWAEPR